MNAQEFYEKMKDALRFFGLRFGDMNLVSMELEGDYVLFHFAGESCKFKVNE
jgi:hypothetical protein